MIISFEYPKKSVLKSSYPKKYLPKFSYQKNPEIKNFKPPKILRSPLSIENDFCHSHSVTSHPIQSNPSFPSVWTCINQSTRQLVLEATTLVTRVRKVVLAGSPVMLAVGLQNDRQNCSNLVAKTRMGVRLSRTPMQKQSLLHWREGDRVFCGWSGGGLQHEGQLTTIFSWTQRWYYQVCKV